MSKRLFHCLAILAFALLVQGCSSFSSKGIAVNPIAIHQASPSQPISTATGTVISGNQAELIPVQAYYAALTVARTATGSGTTTAIRDYVDAGVTLVNSYCLRWFQSLSERDVLKSFEDENSNVIRQLGTALLGLGKANTYFMTSYGAANTAYEGVSRNYGDAFLLAPNSRKVKAQVLRLLDAREKELLGSADSEKSSTPKTFTEAYRRLERFADLCTHSTAKEIVNNALDQSKSTAEEDGRITLKPTDSALATATAQAVATAKTDQAKAEAANQPLKDTIRTLQSALSRQSDATTQQLMDEVKSLRYALQQEQAKKGTEQGLKEKAELELQKLKAAQPEAAGAR